MAQCLLGPCAARAQSTTSPQLNFAMPISSLVVTLEPEQQQQSRTLRSLAALGGVTCGRRVGSRLPLVLEASTLRESERTFEVIRELPGVLLLDLVQLNFEDAGL